MFSLKYFRLLRYTKPSYSLLRCFHHEFSKPESVTDKHKKLSSEPTNLAGAVSKKYKEFRDEDSLEIFDIEEERQRYQTKDQTEMELDDQYLGLNLQSKFMIMNHKL